MAICFAITLLHTHQKHPIRHSSPNPAQPGKGTF
jgi:hypothetical protein